MSSEVHVVQDVDVVAALLEIARPDRERERLVEDRAVIRARERTTRGLTHLMKDVMLLLHNYITGLS